MHFLSLSISFFVIFCFTNFSYYDLLKHLGLLDSKRLINAIMLVDFTLTQFKVIVSDKNGKSISKELKDKEAQPLVGLRIGEIVDASVVGVSSGKIQLRGGSDKSGTPIRKDVHGGVKKYVLLSEGTGMKDDREGIRKRKLVRGNMITEEIYQINCLLLEGNLPLIDEKTSSKDESPDSKKA
jgi:small subunit ribosomal protein S6e